MSPTNRYAGGNQLERVRELFQCICDSVERSEISTPVLFAADSRRSKLPLEPKGFPSDREETILFKSVHVFGVYSIHANYDLSIRLSRNVPWVRVHQNGVAFTEPSCGLQLVHLTLQFDFKKMEKTDRSPVEIVCGFSAKHPGRSGVNVMPWPLASTSCLVTALAPNCTHQKNRVPKTHFICRDPELLVADLEERTFTRRSIKGLYGLEYAQRVYGPKTPKPCRSPGHVGVAASSDAIPWSVSGVCRPRLRDRSPDFFVRSSPYPYPRPPTPEKGFTCTSPRREVVLPFPMAYELFAVQLKDMRSYATPPLQPIGKKPLDSGELMVASQLYTLADFASM